MQAYLLLEDGFCLTGKSFAGKGEYFGEVVFSTSMTGYQEMITDPSYNGQILALTYPLIGNYGVNAEDVESASPKVEAFLIKEYCSRPYNRRAEGSLKDYLEKYNILGVEGIDTRSLTLHLRRAGTMKGVITTEKTSKEELMERLKAFHVKNGQEMVNWLTCPEAYEWSGGKGFFQAEKGGCAGAGCHVVVYDMGVKYSIIRPLSARGCRVTVVPAGTKAEDVMTFKPDGVLLSSGPGDPAELTGLLPEIKALLGRVPLFGVCLGHQLLGLSLGFKTVKLPFGHRGANHPVKELSSDRVQITSQNHGYCVVLEGEQGQTIPTHINLNDGTLEGLENEGLKCFSAQFHPEASPGPHDTVGLFDRFIAMMTEHGKEKR